MIYFYYSNLRKRPHILQPYVYTVINKQIIVAKIRVAPFAFHFFKNCIYSLYKLNDSIVDVGGPPLSPGNQYFQNQSATEHNTIET
jgi:hypothetical protein